ncbi:dUTP diphosphatase [Halanaerobacter jeridensis]|uniref:dUTP diphosphatase n=1 Tax=Halanaerobacter jeridensis TaxID=706427 RepID=A0A939BQA8_9FIRM|nr:dUTP diphosphatase [Halanaerobacter jeridensis]MBM7557918.1 dUTP pyrophosphatase [Halanaerobacter jeridensis]
MGNRQRGFEHVVETARKYDEEGFIPQRATEKSAGYDIKTPIDLEIPPQDYTTFFTNIKAYMQDDEVLKIYIRSSLGFKHGLMLANNVGIIDADYYSNPDNDGNIGIRLYNSSQEKLSFKAGTRICQGIFEKYLTVDQDQTKKSREGGLGSTGR